MTLLVVDGQRFTLRRSERRKTIGITVERNGNLTIAAPADCSTKRIIEVVQKKRLWVETKLAQKEMTFHPPVVRDFVSGEGFYYLGRSYRLCVFNAADRKTPPLDFHHDWFWMRRDQCHRGQELFIRWYSREGKSWLQERVNHYASRLGVIPQNVEIRELGYRWGSCSPSGKLNFHWRTVQLPPRIIDYVVAHEIGHLLIPRHNIDFWDLVDQMMPDYLDRKKWLVENGGRF